MGHGLGLTTFGLTWKIALGLARFNTQFPLSADKGMGKHINTGKSTESPTAQQHHTQQDGLRTPLQQQRYADHMLGSRLLAYLK